MTALVSKTWAWLLLPLTADILSILGSIWLTIRLHNLSPNIKARLFPRQLRSLALADLLFHLSSLPIILIDYAPWITVSTAVASKMCRTSYFVFHIARLVCVFNEMHIALSFLVQSFRRFASPPAMHFSIPFVWLVGILLGFVAGWSNPWTYSASCGLCHPVKFEGGVGGDIISICVIVTCFAVACISYIAVLLRSYRWSTPGSVQNHNFRRAAVYPLNFLITYGFMMVVYCSHSLMNNRDVFATAATLEFLNGFLNTATYALQSRYAAMLWMQSRRCPIVSSADANAPSFSFHVDFGGVDIVEVLYSSIESESSVSEPIEAEASCTPGSQGS